MSYHFTPRIEALISSQWIGVSELTNVVAEIGRLNFSVASDRRAARTMWNTQTAQQHPVAMRTRFPTGKAYVCLNDSDWANKRMQLEHALDYVDATNQQTGNAGQGNQNQNQNQQVGQANNRNAFNDADTAFRNALRTMLDQIRTLDGVWDRAKWERYFPWHASAQDEPTWSDIVHMVSPILPIANVRVATADPSADAWPGIANASTIAAMTTAGTAMVADGAMLVLWSHPRTTTGNVGARCRLTMIRAGNNFIPLSLTPIATND